MVVEVGRRCVARCGVHVLEQQREQQQEQQRQRQQQRRRQQDRRKQAHSRWHELTSKSRQRLLVLAHARLGLDRWRGPSHALGAKEQL